MRKVAFSIAAALALALAGCGGLPREVEAAGADEIAAALAKFGEGRKAADGNVPRVTVRGAFTFRDGDWKTLSDAISAAGGSVRVSLDLSRCRVEGESRFVPGGLFQGAESIEEIRFPEGLLAAGSRSFSSCANLRAVFFPKETAVRTLGWNSFSENPSLAEVHLPKFDGALGECFKDSGARAADAGENAPGEIRLVEMPDHPVFVEGYGTGYHQHAFGNTRVGSVVAGGRTLTLDEWADWGRQMKPRAARIREVSATSELGGEGGKYAAKNAANAHWTSWVEGGAGDGSGESLTLTLAEPTTIRQICIKGGFGNLAYYWANNRPKEISIVLDGDESSARKFTLDDTPFAQYVNIDRYDRLFEKITLRIESVYGGTDGANDCAIDEIAVNAGIARREIYGAYYDSESVPYVYAPEIQRMLKGLYTMDVGAENVRVTEGGFVQVRANDWESGEPYWEQPSGALSGTLFRGFSPGTGGGHSYDRFHIYLNPDGGHFLFKWHEQGYGTFELYPCRLEIYEWREREWRRQTEESHSPALDEIFGAISFIGGRGLSYDFNIAESGDDSACVTAYPNGGALDLPVPLAFGYDGKAGVFLPYKRTAVTELAFGTPESLESLGDWKAEYDGTETGFSPVEIFCYPAAYNRDPAMVDFLRESGLKVESGRTAGDGESGPYNFTALEAWQAGGNTAGVRDALIRAGATYSGEMLRAAFLGGTRDEVRELAPLVGGDFVPMFESVAELCGRRRRDPKLLGHIKACLQILMENGADLNRPFALHRDKNVFLMELALNEGFPELVRLYDGLGVELPRSLGRYSTIGMGTPMGCARYRFYDGYSDEDPDAPRVRDALELLDFLIGKGLDVNERTFGGGNTMLHACGSHGAHRGDAAFAKILLSRGADVNARNDGGETPLHSLIASDGLFGEEDARLADILIQGGGVSDIPMNEKQRRTMEEMGFPTEKKPK